MAEFKISLGVKVNTADIQKQINNSIRNTQFRKIKVELNTKRINAQINSIRSQIKQLGNIKINLGGYGTTSASSSGIKKSVNDMNWAYRQMLSIQKKANSLSLKINGLDTSKNVNELKELSLQFARLKSDYEVLKRVFGGQISTAQWGNLQAEIDETNAKLSAMDAKFADTKTKLASGIKLKIADGTYASQIQSLETKFSSLSNKSKTLRTSIDSVKQALIAMQAASNSGDIQALIAAEERYKTALKNVENQLRINKSVEQQANNTASLNQARQKLALDMANWLKSNSAAAKQFGAEIQKLQARINSCDRTGLSNLRAEFNNITRQATLAGKATQTFGDRLKTQFSKYSSYFGISSIFMYTTMAIRSMFTQVVAIDSAMTELKKVTDETSASYDNFLTNASSKAKEIGTTIDGLVQSTAGFARLGYSFEESQGLAEVANIYAVVGDEIESVETATQSLISTMAAFREQANGMSNDDFALSIVDKFNEIGKLIA